jgi:ABC-type antimicrobial peptide transport system permease subunit
MYFATFAVLVGILAGFLPALFFSRINAVQVLRNASSLKVFRHINLRKVLIVVQYTFSLTFIAATIIGYNQYKNFLEFDLGFKTENILNIRLQGNNSDLLVKELSSLPEVIGISKSLMVTSVGSYYGSEMKYNNPLDSVVIWFNSIDENYLPLHGHKLIAGKNFAARPSKKEEESEVIVNEQVLKRFNIGEKIAAKALGEIVTVDGKKLAIIGVMKDFHYGKVENPIEPVIFRYYIEAGKDRYNGYVNANIKSADLPATLAKVDQAWRTIDKVHPLDAKFYDEQIERAYTEFSAMIKIIGFLSFLAISIASMGMFGMVVFTTETRMKEISIRKVLGATSGNLIYLLSKNFLFLLSISATIALPITYVFFDQVVLVNITYHVPIGPGELVIGTLAVMTIAFVMIGSQTLKVARSNPADVLKSE